MVFKIERWPANQQNLHCFVARVRQCVAMVLRDVDRIACTNRSLFISDFHDTLPTQDIIDLFEHFVMMRRHARTRRQYFFS